MTNNDHVNPYEIGKAGLRDHGKKIPPITEAPVDADKHYSVIPSTGVYGTVWPSSMMSAQDGLPQTLGPSLPQGFQGKISSAGWTKGAEGFDQQTFLGASIVSFNITTGFGNSSSSLNVSLVNDEHNASDGTWYGSGDDVYHRGATMYRGERLALGDEFIPPAVGTPVFFKFGRQHATVSQAWFKTYFQKYGGRFVEEPPPNTYTTTDPIESRNDHAYMVFENSKNIQYANIKHDTGKTPQYFWEDTTLPPVAEYFGNANDFVGWNHFVFGGILSSVSESKSNSNTFSVSVTDPREILSNTTLILSDYQGTTFNNKNLYNIYGFLEYDFSEDFLEQMEGYIKERRPLTRSSSGGSVVGNDTYIIETTPFTDTLQVPALDYIGDPVQAARLYGPSVYPMTGQGFSRKTEFGIPVYRINQALSTMFNYEGRMWQEHIDGGFGGPIDFRGYNYVVDLGGVPFSKVPPLYNIDQSQIDLLSYIQEICETINHDYHVSLLPVLNLPPTKYLWLYNQSMMAEGRYGDIITGVIRVDTVDRSVIPQPGAVEKYVNILTDRYSNDRFRDGDNSDGNSLEINRKTQDRKYIESKNIGYDLSNITTDKFVTGAQEVGMYAFSTCKDTIESFNARKNYFRSQGEGESEKDIQQQYETKRDIDVWSLEYNLKKQVLPFYGFLGEEAVTIPIGEGPFQQIMLDSSSVDAKNVGDYYITTQMELRAATISYNAWVQFLKYYNERYVELFNTYKKYNGPIPVEDYTDFNILSRSAEKEVNNKNAEFDEELLKESVSFRKLTNFDPDDPEETSYYIQSLACSVPRCAFNSAKPYIDKNGYPVDACSPPYGFPLYYKRAERIGAGGGGYVDVLQKIKQVQSSQEAYLKELQEDLAYSFFSSALSDANLVSKVQINEDAVGEYVDVSVLQNVIAEIRKKITEIHERNGKPQLQVDQSKDNKKYTKYSKEIKPYQQIITKLQEAIDAVDDDGNVGGDLVNDLVDKYTNAMFIQDLDENNGDAVQAANKGLRLNLENSKKVYEFIKGVADKYLGKQFLVKIPRYTNTHYKFKAGPHGNAGETAYTDAGPFGFPPRYNDARKNTEDGGISKLYNPNYKDYFSPLATEDKFHFLLTDSGIDKRLKYREGALRSSWNDIEGVWDHNYKPENQGGFFDWISYESGVHNGNHIFPYEPSPLTEGNRIKPYVVFLDAKYFDITNVVNSNHTHELSQSPYFKQEVTTDAFLGFSTNLTFIPDWAWDQTNNNDNRGNSDDFNRSRYDKAKKQTWVESYGDLESRQNARLFVESSISEKFYMPPKTRKVKSYVYGDRHVWVKSPLIWYDVKTENDKGEEEITAAWKLPPLQWRPGHPILWRGTDYDTTKFADDFKAKYYDTIVVTIPDDLVAPEDETNEEEGERKEKITEFLEETIKGDCEVYDFTEFTDYTGDVELYIFSKRQDFPYNLLYSYGAGYSDAIEEEIEELNKTVMVTLSCLTDDIPPINSYLLGGVDFDPNFNENGKIIQDRFFGSNVTDIYSHLTISELEEMIKTFEDISYGDNALDETGYDIYSDGLSDRENIERSVSIVENWHASNNLKIQFTLQDIVGKFPQSSASTAMLEYMFELGYSYHDFVFKIAKIAQNTFGSFKTDIDIIQSLGGQNQQLKNEIISLQTGFQSGFSSTGLKTFDLGDTLGHLEIILETKKAAKDNKESTSNPTGDIEPCVIEDFVRVDKESKEISKIEPIDYTPENGSLSVQTNLKDLDEQHVYAIVTLPGAVYANGRDFMNAGLTTKESWSKAHRSVEYAKLSMLDVTSKFAYKFTGDDGFEKRKYTAGFTQIPTTVIKYVYGEEDEGTLGVNSYLKNYNLFLERQQTKISSPEVEAQFTTPTPITPDVFVLSLMSTERSYGPWLSAGSGPGFQNIGDIGGKVEFIKDENLAPWNYGGYSEMNNVGSSKAQFSNSLQLYSEKGSIVIADAPTGISIGDPLIAGGPLITSVSVSVSDGGIKTTVNMDSYSNNFGRLTKQKEDQIAKLTRDRQKNIDKENELRRKGILKTKASNLKTPDINFRVDDNNGGPPLLRNSYGKEDSLYKGNTVYSTVVWSVDEDKIEVNPVENASGSVNHRILTATASMQHDGYLAQVQEQMKDYVEMSLASKKTAGNSLNSMFIGYDKSVHNPFMPTKEYNPNTAKLKRMRF